MEVKVYKLLCPNTKKVRYVGVTTKRLWERLASHIGEIGKQFKGRDKQIWIRGLLKNHQIPIIELITKVPFDEWEKWEIFYIDHYLQQGCDLLNGTGGGAGLRLTDKVRKRCVKKRLENGNYIPEGETRLKMSKAAKARTGKDRYQTKQIRGTKEGEEPLLFWGAGEAERFLKSKGIKISKKNISACLNGKERYGHIRQRAGGYKWEWV